MDNPNLRRARAGFLLAQALYRATTPTGEPAAAKPRRAVRARAQRPPVAEPPALKPIPTQRLFGISVAELTRDEVVERIIAWSGETPARTVITANLDHVMKLRHDRLFQRVYREADLVTADGMPFVWLSKREGAPLKERVTGSDLIEPLARAAAAAGRSVFLFGSTMERLHGAAKRLKADNPRLDLRGAYAPPFGFERDLDITAEVLRMIRIARPDIILVALGAPKQEIWSNGMADSVRHGVFVNIGGGLDFLSQDVRRAPGWMQDAGLEWLWRAGSEPTRLGPRYFGILAALPSLYRMHQSDRAEFEATERRRAMAALSDARYRGERARVREAEADAAAADSALEPLRLGPQPERDFERA